MCRVVLLLPLLLSHAVALAAESAAQPARNTAPTPLTSFFQVSAALMVTLALVLLATMLLRRTSLGGRAPGMQVETRLILARGASLAVVRVEGRRLLMGVTASGIRLLTELGAAEPGTAPAPTGGFDRLLAGLLRREHPRRERRAS